MMQEYTIKEEGYVFMYVSNENATLVDVYFDDITMTHTKGNIIQYNEYYPFGMQTANSWTRENITGNNFLYNESTELNTSTGYYDLFFRNFDPALGRFMQVDPLASIYHNQSTYQYGNNDPIYWTDPSGAGGDEAVKRIGNTFYIDWNATGSYGGSWSNGSGGGGGFTMFGTSMDAFYSGAALIDQSNSWGYVKGGAGSYEAAALAYKNATGVMPLSGVVVSGQNGSFSGEPYSNGNWLNKRLNRAAEIMSHSIDFWNTMNNPLVQNIHNGQEAFMANPFGGGLMAFLSGGGLMGGGAIATRALSGLRALRPLASSALTNFAKFGIRNIAIETSTQMIFGQGTLQNRLRELDIIDIAISGFSGQSFILSGVGGGLFDGSINGGIETMFDKGIYGTAVDVGTGVLFGGANHVTGLIPGTKKIGTKLETTLDFTVELYGGLTNYTLNGN
jgi:RHS repeat-associated protein